MSTSPPFWLDCICLKIWVSPSYLSSDSWGSWISTINLHLGKNTDLAYVTEVCVSCPVVSDSLGSHGLQHIKLVCLWDFPGKNTGVGCHFLLQGIFPTQGSNPGLLHCRQILYCLCHQGSLENPMDRGAWRAAVQGVAKSQTTQQQHTHTHAHTHRGIIDSDHDLMIPSGSWWNPLCLMWSIYWLGHCILQKRFKLAWLLPFFHITLHCLPRDFRGSHTSAHCPLQDWIMDYLPSIPVHAHRFTSSEHYCHSWPHDMAADDRIWGCVWSYDWGFEEVLGVNIQTTP